MGYYLVLFFSSFCSLFSKNIKEKQAISILLIIFLGIIAGTRSDSPDFVMYYDIFHYKDDTIKHFKERDIPLEWCMYIIPNFYSFILDNKESIIKCCFLTFAFLGVGTKIIAIKKYAAFFTLSIMLYVSNLFIMMEMTTIRAGVAAGIFMLSLSDLKDNDNKNFFIKLLFCFFFHNSSAVYIIPWLLLKFKINIKYYYFALIFSFIMIVLKMNIIHILFLDRIFPRIELYLKMMEWQKNEGTNIFNFRALFALTIVIIMGIYYKKLKDLKYFDILFKIHIISICIFFLLSVSTETFSIRTFEMFSVVQILLYPMIVNLFNKKNQFIGWVIIILFSLLQIYYLIDVADIYKPYKSWLF